MVRSTLVYKTCYFLIPTTPPEPTTPSCNGSNYFLQLPQTRLHSTETIGENGIEICRTVNHHTKERITSNLVEYLVEYTTEITVEYFL